MSWAMAMIGRLAPSSVSRRSARTPSSITRPEPNRWVAMRQSSRAQLNGISLPLKPRTSS